MNFHTENSEFAYSGWNVSTYLGAEIKNPLKKLPRSLMPGIGIVMFLYLALNALYIWYKT